MPRTIMDAHKLIDCPVCQSISCTVLGQSTVPTLNVDPNREAIRYEFNTSYFIQIPDNVNRNSGLTSEEQEIMDHILDAWHKLMILGLRDDHMHEAQESIHNLQRILGQRVLQRLFPGYWKGRK